ncbi:hypothetical protein GGQ87_001472 [Brevundimonas alba]|uniref:Uncharacterized protein n=1 Tax=Brevundimonas alba TaxID=74314 RepID=A0A7X5YM75_9CAUL|nr:hypothetical protein [Brevundimonas alba]NJC41214.1 hypothetical protein [Brevundimonas alba]
MRIILPLLVAALAAAGPAWSQTAPRAPEGVRIYTPGQFGVTAETPSRMAASREAMNHGRNGSASPDSNAAAREQAAAAVGRAGLLCTVAEAAVIGRTRDGGPLLEIDCVEGGGVIIADTDPMQVVDCLDLAPDEGQAGRRQRVVSACRLPGNAGLAGLGQSARN